MTKKHKRASMKTVGTSKTNKAKPTQQKIKTIQNRIPKGIKEGDKDKQKGI